MYKPFLQWNVFFFLVAFVPAKGWLKCEIIFYLVKASCIQGNWLLCHEVQPRVYVQVLFTIHTLYSGNICNYHFPAQAPLLHSMDICVKQTDWLLSNLCLEVMLEHIVDAEPWKIKHSFEITCSGVGFLTSIETSSIHFFPSLAFSSIKLPSDGFCCCFVLRQSSV